MKIYTRKGDDGTTGLFHGGRVRKDDPAPAAYGEVDEAQATLGVARAEAGAGTELDALLIGIEHDLYVLMAELATAAENCSKLVAGESLVTAEMVRSLEVRIDDLSSRFDTPTEFVVPGENRLAALLDVARTVVRRAERGALDVAAPGSHVVPYLNRLSDLLWTMARWQAGSSLVTKHTQPMAERTEDS